MIIPKPRAPSAPLKHLLFASSSTAVLLLASATIASAQTIIDLSGGTIDAGAQTVHTTGGLLTINVINSSNSIDPTHTLVFNQGIGATNGGTLALNIGEGDVNDLSPLSTGAATGFIVSDVVEQTGGTVTITLGSSTSTTANFLAFYAGQATQTIDAAIFATDDADTVGLTIGTDVGGGARTTFRDTITLGADDKITIGNDTAPGGIEDDIAVVFEDDVTSPGGIDLQTSSTVNVDLLFGLAGNSSTVTGNLNVTTGGGAANLTITNGATVLLDGNIDSSNAWTGIMIGGGTQATQFTVRGNIDDDAPVTLTDQATLIIDTTASSSTIHSTVDADADASTVALQVVGTTGDGTTALFNADVGGTHGIDRILLSDDATFAGTLTSGDVTISTNATMTLHGTNSSIAGDVTGDGTIQLGDGAGDALIFNGGTTAQIVEADILFGTAAQGILDITNTRGITFNGAIGSTGRAQATQIAQDNQVTFNSSVATEAFTVGGTGTTLTFNATSGTQVTIGGGTSGALTLDAGTIILGSNISGGDTVFDVTAGVATDTAFQATGGSPAIAIEVSSAFFSGTITLVDGDVNDTVSDTEIANITVAETALATYTINQESVNNQDLVITAVSRSTQEIAEQLNVSTQDAAILQSALDLGDPETGQAIADAVDAGGTKASQTIQQLGIQSSTTGADSAVTQRVAEQNRELAGNQLSARRGAGDTRFASAFASVGETGFSGGDTTHTFSTGSVWAEAFGGIADAEGNAISAGYDASFGGIAFGLDGMVNDNLVLGLIGSYSSADVDGDDLANSQVQSTTYLLGIYGSYTDQSFYVDGFASFAFGDHETRRSSLGQTYTGHYDSSQVALALSAGLPIEVSTNLYLTPNASLTWNHFSAERYTETGGALAQTINPERTNQLTGTVGTRLHTVLDGFDASGTTLIPELRIGLSYDLIDDDAVSAAAFSGGGTSYQVTSLDTNDLGALIGLGLSLDNPRWSTSLAYNGDVRSDLVRHTVSAQVRLQL